MWLRAEVDESKKCSLAICQQPSFKRYYKLLAIGVPAPSESVFGTEIVPTDLLGARQGQLLQLTTLFVPLITSSDGVLQFTGLARIQTYAGIFI